MIGLRLVSLSSQKQLWISAECTFPGIFLGIWVIAKEEKRPAGKVYASEQAFLARYFGYKNHILLKCKLKYFLLCCRNFCSFSKRGSSTERQRKTDSGFSIFAQQWKLFLHSESWKGLPSPEQPLYKELCSFSFSQIELILCAYSRTIIPNKLNPFLGPHDDQLLHPVQEKDSLSVNTTVWGMVFKECTSSITNNFAYLHISYQRKPSP